MTTDHHSHREATVILRRSAKRTCYAEETVSSRPRQARLTRAQITHRRYNDWRVQHDIGWPDGEGELRRRSVSALAALYRVSRQTAHYGIKSARQIQEDLQAIGADSC
jgi:hypothetical protein